ncbi:hypothetical protein LR948_16475 [Roseivivax sp. GX 12232]|uniref:hypothetical protein n=1 Tax=Roseivivax sp. GX 12232 TaxID=2900547 RepID=UPI001E46F644|nr:hypothetical protein [Roseivivax sp. GX 12232]MCE0506967.1 hypothetical protein [Roseivivax sp. GX 12232]
MRPKAAPRLALSLCLFLAAPLAEAAPAGFVPHAHNGRDPEMRGGEVHVSLPAADCSETEYINREVSDCYNGNSRAMLKSTRLIAPGEAARYRFEVLVEEPLRYGGGPNRRSLLTIADWRRDRTSQNKLYALHLDARRGLRFGDTPCLSPADFGDWAQIEVLIRYDAERGLLRVRCDGRQVIARQGIDTLVPADCAAPYTYQCRPELQEPDHPVEMRLGLLHQGYGPLDRKRGLSPRGRVLRAPVGLRLRELSVERVRLAPGV